MGIEYPDIPKKDKNPQASLIRKTMRPFLRDLEERLMAKNDLNKEQIKEILDSVSNVVKIFSEVTKQRDDEIFGLLEKWAAKKPVVIPDKFELSNLSELTKIIEKAEKREVIVKLDQDMIKVNFSTDPAKPVSVRLSDGKKFYDMMNNFITTNSHPFQDPSGKATRAKLVKPSSGSAQDVNSIPVVNPDGSPVGSNITLQTGDIEIGAVEIKDGNTDARAVVDVDGLIVKARQSQGLGNTLSGIITTASGISQLLGNPKSNFKKFVRRFNSGQSNQEIWTPESGRKFVITDMSISASSGGNIRIFDNSDTLNNTVEEYTLATNGGVVQNYKEPMQSSAANNVLKYTTVSGIVGILKVQGYEI